MKPDNETVIPATADVEFDDEEEESVEEEELERFDDERIIRHLVTEAEISELTLEAITLFFGMARDAGASVVILTDADEYNRLFYEKDPGFYLLVDGDYQHVCDLRSVVYRTLDYDSVLFLAKCLMGTGRI